MAKATKIEELKSDYQKAKAEEETIITDALGRKLTIRQPTILDESRLVRVMGEASSNQGYMLGYVMPAAMVIAIDGETYGVPTTEMQVDGAIQRLGREGMAAVMDHIIAAGDGKAATREEAADTIKK